MNNTFRIFIRPPTHSVYIHVYIIAAFAFLIVFNGSAECFSPPGGEFFRYQRQSYTPRTSQTGARVVFYTNKFTTNGVNQIIKFFSFVPIDIESVSLIKKPIRAQTIPKKGSVIMP